MIVVLGQGRTGTSVTMQMLNAAGLNCLGGWPAFEADGFVMPPFDLESLRQRTAVKILYMGKTFTLPKAAQVIITIRDTDACIRSDRKFRQAMFGQLPGDLWPHEPISETERLLWHQYQAAVMAIGGRRRHLILPFEGTIEKPEHAAQVVSDFIGMGEPARMASVVRERTADCYPGLLEAELLVAEPVGPV